MPSRIPVRIDSYTSSRVDAPDPHDILKLLKNKKRIENRVRGDHPPIVNVRVTHVPGDGKCLFHCIATALNTDLNTIQVSLAESLDSIKTHMELKNCGIKGICDIGKADFGYIHYKNIISKYKESNNWKNFTYGGSSEMLLLSKICNGQLRFTTHQISPSFKPQTLSYGSPPARSEKFQIIDIDLFFCHFNGSPNPSAAAGLNHYDLITYELSNGKSFHYWPFNESEEHRKHRYKLINNACIEHNNQLMKTFAQQQLDNDILFHQLVNENENQILPTSNHPVPVNSICKIPDNNPPELSSSGRPIRKCIKKPIIEVNDDGDVEPVHNANDVPPVKSSVQKPKAKNISNQPSVPIPPLAPTKPNENELIIAENISADYIYHQIPIQKTIKFHYKPLFISLCRILFTRYLNARDNKRTGEMILELKRILNLPKSVLAKGSARSTARRLKWLMSHPPDLKHPNGLTPPVRSIHHQSGHLTFNNVSPPNDTDAHDVEEHLARRSIQRACNIVREGDRGCLKRAMKCLLQKSSSLPELDDKLLHEVERLHPADTISLTHSEMNVLRCNALSIPPITSVDLDTLSEIIRTRVNNGSAPGPSGWTGDHLQTIMEDEVCAKGVAALITDIYNGSSSLDEIRDLILGSVLITPKKPNGSLRPIAMGEIFYKTAAHYAMHTIQCAIPYIFPTVQYGISKPGGSVRAAHLIRNVKSLFDISRNEQDTIILSTDFANAFNATSRSRILQSVLKDDRCAKIWPLFYFAYGGNSPLHMFDPETGELWNNFISQNGVRQGDPLAAFAFAHTVQPLYTKINTEVPDVYSVAIQDDLTLIGPAKEVFRAFDILKNESTNYCLNLQNEKCSVLLSKNIIHHDFIVCEANKRQLQVCKDVFKVLGTYIARGPETEQMLRDLYISDVMDHNVMFDRLTHKLMKDQFQIAFALLRSCALPRMNFHTCTAYPHLLSDAAELFDKKIIDCFLKLSNINIEQLNEFTRNQIELPLRIGGMGLRPVHRTMHPAFLSASLLSLTDLIKYCKVEGEQHWSTHPLCTTMDKCIDVISQRLVGANDAVRANILKFDLINQPCAHLWERFKINIESKNRKIKKDLDDLMQFLESGLQQKLVAAIELTMQEKMLLKTDVIDNRSRLVALSTPNAARALTVLPIEPRYTLSTFQMQCALRMRLGLIPKQFMVDADCDCGKSHPYAVEPMHLHSCNRLKGTAFTARHDLIKNGFARALREIGASVIVEPSARAARTSDASSSQPARRADLLYMHAEGCGFIDVSVTHPLINKFKHNQLVPPVSTEQLYAARRAEQHKIKIYEKNGSYNDFPVTPAIFETFGGFGPELTKLLKNVSKFDSSHPTHAVYDRLVSTLAVLLVRGNYALELSGVPKALNHYASEHFTSLRRGAAAIYDA